MLGPNTDQILDVFLPEFQKFDLLLECLLFVKIRSGNDILDIFKRKLQLTKQ